MKKFCGYRAIKELTGNFYVTKIGVEHVHIERGGAFHNEAFMLGIECFFLIFLSKSTKEQSVFSFHLCLKSGLSTEGRGPYTTKLLYLNKELFLYFPV